MSTLNWFFSGAPNMAAGLFILSITGYSLYQILRRYHRMMINLLREFVYWLLVPSHIQRVIAIVQIIYNVSKEFGLLNGGNSKADHLAGIVGAGITAMPKSAVKEVESRINEDKKALKTLNIAIDDKRQVDATLKVGGMNFSGGWNPLNGEFTGGVGASF